MRLVAHRGFTLLEVLIALLVFSLGILGLAGLMVVSVRTNNSAYLRTQASFLAQSMADRMRANTGKINDYIGDYDALNAAADACETVACNPDELVARDIAVWSGQVKEFLPNARASIACDGASLGTPITSGAATYDGLCTLTIKWTEAQLDKKQVLTAPDDQTFAWVFQP